VPRAPLKCALSSNLCFIFAGPRSVPVVCRAFFFVFLHVPPWKTRTFCPGLPELAPPLSSLLKSHPVQTFIGFFAMSQRAAPANETFSPPAKTHSQHKLVPLFLFFVPPPYTCLNLGTDLPKPPLGRPLPLADARGVRGSKPPKG